MNNGMLWRIDDPKVAFSKSIQIAVEYYAKKFGRVPELCLVNEKMAIAELAPVEFMGKLITVKPFKGCLPNHLWIGVEDQAAYIPAGKVKESEL